ncbi:OmpA family protein [Hymenobacter siberiensis]|uniref:OmpA family protein n=1 Tax=Hymenobacter siberiensis TaxID=2848396 RepID=UPI001C1E80B6|nr:OmpA family protein [Hymenobacter siberiensis]
MKNTVNESVSYCFTRETIARLGTRLDEAAPSVEYALRQAVHLVLNELSDRVGHGLTPEGLLELVREADSAQVLQPLADLHPAARYERGVNLLLDLLDGAYRSTVSRIAAGAAIRPSASDTLLQIAATAVLGVLGHAATEKSLSPTDFVYWLHTEKAAIATAMLPASEPGLVPPLPPELSLRYQPVQPVQLAPTPAAWAEPNPETADGWAISPYWQWGGLLLLAVCLGYFFGHSTPRQDQPLVATSLVAETNPQSPPAASTAADIPLSETAPAEAPGPTPEAAAMAVSPAPALGSRLVEPLPSRAPASGAYRLATARPAAGGNEPNGRYDQDRDTYIYDTGRPIVLTLADGTTQKVGANSTENRLYTFLSSPAFQVDSVNRTKGWINLDRINFETGKAQLTPESALQLGNIASILTTFPKSVVKIGGYTDSTGEALVNYQLSEDRARAAMLTLASMGVSADRLQAKGYGPKYFVRPNNTPANRALNRRVSIRVLRK